MLLAAVVRQQGPDSFSALLPQLIAAAAEGPMQVPCLWLMVLSGSWGVIISVCCSSSSSSSRFCLVLLDVQPPTPSHTLPHFNPPKPHPTHPPNPTHPTKSGGDQLPGATICCGGHHPIRGPHGGVAAVLPVGAADERRRRLSVFGQGASRTAVALPSHCCCIAPPRVSAQRFGGAVGEPPKLLVIMLSRKPAPPPPPPLEPQHMPYPTTHNRITHPRNQNHNPPSKQLLQDSFSAGIAAAQQGPDAARPHAAVVTAALGALSSYVEWAPMLRIANGSVIEACAFFLGSPDFREGALGVLKQVCGRRSTREGQEAEAYAVLIDKVRVRFLGGPHPQKKPKNGVGWGWGMRGGLWVSLGWVEILGMQSRDLPQHALPFDGPAAST